MYHSISILVLLVASGVAVSANQEPTPKALTPSLSYDWQTAAGPEALVHVLDPEVLNHLESKGFSLNETLGGSGSTSKTSELYKSSKRYRSFAEVIGKNIPHDEKTDQLPAIIPPGQGDIPEMVRLLRNFEDKGSRSDRDKKGGYFIRELSNNSQHPYAVEYDGDEPRHFDYRWLNSNFGYFKLIAITNRTDRKDFDQDSCGEVRFIYRLSYKSEASRSSMPFFLNVVTTYPKRADCTEFAKAWLISQKHSEALKQQGAQAPAQFAKLLRKRMLAGLSFKQVEINFQSLRFTSGYMHDFGGQAMYMQRVFLPQGDQLIPGTLENTPDVLAIEKDPKLLQKFVAYLKKPENLKALDEGHINLDFDDRFLAKLAVSWSTLGRGRSANKPYARLFASQTELLKTIDISELKHIKTHRGLVERLDNLTCMGCHQSGGTAGFHILGYPDEGFSHGFNRQGLPLSPHAYADSFRRKHYLLALANGKTPNSLRPHSVFGEAQWASNKVQFARLTQGQICVLNQAHFAGTPQCETGLRCTATVGNKSNDVLFGECVQHEKPLAGSACWQGDIQENLSTPSDRGTIPSYNFFAFQDKWALTGALPKGEGYKCVLPQSGAPLGRSSRACTLAEENFSSVQLTANQIPGELCANQGGNGFDLCAASGDSGACLESRVVRSMLDTCYPGHFCREDYICQKFPEYQKISKAHYSTKKGGKPVNLSLPEKINGRFIAQAHEAHIGFCVPTYFLFNMRVDGHPSPLTGKPSGAPKIDRSQPLRGYKNETQ